MANRKDTAIQIRTTGIPLVKPSELLFEVIATSMVEMFKAKLSNLEGKPSEIIWARENWVEAARVAYIEIARAGGAIDKPVPEVPARND